MYKINVQSIMDDFGEQFYRELGLRPAKIKNVNEIVIAWINSLNLEDYNTFTDFLKYVSENTIITKNQLISLTKVNYFSKFGGNKKLVKIVDEFFSVKTTEALKILESDLIDESYSERDQSDYEYELLEHYNLKFAIAKNYVLVTNVEERGIDYDDYFMREWSPRITMFCLSYASASDKQIQKMKMPISVYKKYPLCVGDIIYCNSCRQHPKKHYDKEHNKFIVDPVKKEWWLNSYQPVSGDDFREIASKGFLH